MNEEVATRAADEQPCSSDTVRLARLQFDGYRRRVFLEERWALRHPLYARLLHLPVVGEPLRERRQRYVSRMLKIL